MCHRHRAMMIVLFYDDLTAAASAEAAKYIYNINH
jgi:hypothetical protein